MTTTTPVPVRFLLPVDPALNGGKTHLDVTPPAAAPASPRYVGRCPRCRFTMAVTEAQLDARGLISRPVMCWACASSPRFLGVDAYAYGPAIDLRRVEGRVTDHQCDARCQASTKHVCECACGGKNHGASWGA